MKKLRELKESFINDISNNFSKSSAKKIMTKSTLALLAVSITSGAMASTMPVNQGLNNTEIKTMNQYFTDCHDHSHEMTHINDIINKNKIKVSENTKYPKGEQSGLQIENPEYLLELTPKNFKEIIKNGISGVYKHPFVEGEVATFIFDNDKRENPFSIISKQLIDLGLDREGFASEYRGLASLHAIEKNVFFNEPHSSHLQFKHEHYDDTNFSKIYTGNKNLEESDYIEILNTIIHESAHSLKHQQGDNWDHIFNGYEQGIKAETSSFTAEGLMGYKFAKEAGHEKIFLDLYGYSGMTGHEILRVKGSNDTHLYSPASAFITKLLEDNPDMIISMTDKEIVKISDVISDASINYNFKDDFEEFLKEEASEMYQIVQKISDKENDEYGSTKRYKEIINKRYDQLNIDNGLSSKDQDVVKMKEVFDLFEEDAAKLSYDDFKDFYIENKMEDLLGNSDTLKLTDKNINHLITKISLDGFVSEVGNNKDISKIMNRISSKNNQSILAKEKTLTNTELAEQDLLKEISKDLENKAPENKNRNLDRTTNKLNI